MEEEKCAEKAGIDADILDTTNTDDDTNNEYKYSLTRILQPSGRLKVRAKGTKAW